MIDKLTVIHRADIRSISEIMDDGKLEFLGEQRDFRRNEMLAEFLADHGRLGIAWVRLGPGQVLASHRHPVRSMILVCRGHGVAMLEDRELPLIEGDAILVPAGCYHGFRGSEPDGVDGLSVQFEERGLYEDEDRPLVSFVS